MNSNWALMGNLRDNIIRGTQDVHMTEDDRAAMRERLVAYMEYMPITRPTLGRRARGSWVSFGAFFRAHHIAGALMIALLFTTSTVGVSSAAAAAALPGDLLYPVKIHLNEGVRTVFMSSEEAKLTWERERAEKRLEEAGQLAAEGRFDAKAQEEVARRFAEHTEKVVEKVQRVEATDPVLAAEVSGEFEEALDTHEVMLARLAEEHAVDTESGEAAHKLVAQVHSAAAQAEGIRVAAEEKIAFEDIEVAVAAEPLVGAEHASSNDDSVTTAVSVGPQQHEGGTPKTESANMHVRAAYRAQERAMTQFNRAQTLLDTIEDDSPLYTPARAQVARGNERMAAGEQALSEHKLGHAYTAYRDAAGRFQKVAELLEAADLFTVGIGGEEAPSSVNSLEEVQQDEKEVPQELPNGMLGGGSHDDAQEPLSDIRTRVRSAVADARQQLLGFEGYDLSVTEEVNALIRDAAAELLRADIYRVLGDELEERAQLVAADEYSSRALGKLAKAIEQGSVSEIVIEDVGGAEEPDQPDGGVEENGTLPKPAENADAADPQSGVSVMHTVRGDMHTVSGTYYQATTSCQTVDAVLTLLDASSTELALELSTGEDTTQCVDEMVWFEATTTATTSAVFTSLSVDGVSTFWEKLTPAQSETVVDEEKTQSSLFRRTFDGARKMLGVE